MVEHSLGKGEVGGSIPLSSTINYNKNIYNQYTTFTNKVLSTFLLTLIYQYVSRERLRAGVAPILKITLNGYFTVS